jgi:hypothetical protein
MPSPFENELVKQLLSRHQPQRSLPEQIDTSESSASVPTLEYLDAGIPNSEACKRLKSLTLEQLFAPNTIVDHSMAMCCLSGLWLWHNDLDRSHQISQDIHTAAGSAWHGLMHRREGDFWNANYWFAKVRDASLFEKVADHFKTLQGDLDALHQPLRSLLLKPWDAAAFTNIVERVIAEPNEVETKSALLVATAEWMALFEACWHRTIR